MAVPNLWRTKKQRYRLQAEICPTCAHAVFPPREICPHCRQSIQGVQTGCPKQEYGFMMLLALPQATAPAVRGDD
jgi:predicted amidophosphoribosyltransferase